MIKTLLKLVIVLLIVMLLAIGGVVIWLYLNFQPEAVDIKAADRPADQRLLFIGNSFTHANDLDQMVAALVAESNPEWDDVLAIRIAPGGWMIVDHANDLQNIAGNPPLRQALITGSATLRDWDLIVIQGQSQIMGFDDDHWSKQQLLTSAPIIAKAARDTGATTMLFMTWGYANGDDMNPGIYPDYLTMQARLQQNYDTVAADLSARIHGTIYVAPAGLGFRAVYEDIRRSGADPLAPDAFFRRLYAGDAYHPSLAGSYLAACVIAASYTGRSMAALSWKPEGLSATDAAYLRAIADQVVLGHRYGIRNYPE